MEPITPSPFFLSSPIQVYLSQKNSVSFSSAHALILLEIFKNSFGSQLEKPDKIKDLISE